MRSQKIIHMAETALLSALLCMVAPITIPVPMSPIPCSLATLIVYLSAGILGAKRGAVSVVVYLLLGMVGLPVFSGFSGGMGILLGPTGGYLLGYVPCALIAGWLMQWKPTQAGGTVGQGLEVRWRQVLWNVFCMVSGMTACYAFGTAWFLMVMEEAYTLPQALLVCVVPYLLFDSIKTVVAASIAGPVRKILRRMEQ